MRKSPKKLDFNFISGLSEGYQKAGYSIPKWVGFAAMFLAMGYEVSYYDAKTTVSKYIYLKKNRKIFKVRFSNHKPNLKREALGDCDFFVGVTNFSVTRTEDAVKAALEFFKMKEEEA